MPLIDSNSYSILQFQTIHRPPENDAKLIVHMSKNWIKPDITLRFQLGGGTLGGTNRNFWGVLGGTQHHLGEKTYSY